MLQQIFNTVAVIVEFLLVIGGALWLARWISKRASRGSDKYFQEFASSHNWSFRSIPLDREPFDIQPLTQYLHTEGSIRPAPIMERYVQGTQDGFIVTIADIRVWHKAFLYYSRSAHFMFALHIPLEQGSNFAAFPDRVPFDAFSFEKMSNSQQVLSYFVAGNVPVKAEAIVRLLQDSSIQYVHLVLTNDSLYLVSPYRPDLQHFTELAVKVAQSIR